MEATNLKQKYRHTLEQIYAVVELTKVLEHLEPQESGNRIICICPACGQRRAFAYKDRKIIQCNRVKSCGYRATILQFVAGKEHPRGECFKKAVAHLADLAGLPRPETTSAVLDQQWRQRLNKPQPIAKQQMDSSWLDDQMLEAQEQFEKSNIAAQYLLQRKIPIELAKQYQVGFAPYGHWPHYNESKRLIRQWRPGRIVFPVWQGNDVINLYGRVAGPCPHRMRHDFLPGLKGVWNGNVLSNNLMVYLPEGVFDALSLIAAGHPNTGAINGCHGIDWVKVKAKVICFCLDPETIGSKRWQSILTHAARAGKKVVYLPAESFRGCKDLNQLWMKHRRIDTKVKAFDVKEEQDQ